MEFAADLIGALQLAAVAFVRVRALTLPHGWLGPSFMILLYLTDPQQAITYDAADIAFGL